MGIIKLKCGNCNKVSEAREIVTYVKYECPNCKKINEVTNIPLKEWLDFNYKSFLESIEDFIKRDRFENLLAMTETEKLAGYLTQRDINKLKNVLIKSFKLGESIKQINERIRREIYIPDLYKMENDKLITDEAGNKILAVNSKDRSLMITRTETTRTATGGALDNYNENSVQEVKFLASMSQRTCPECESLNGKIYNVTEAYNIIPVHPYCRCTFLPVVKS